MKSFKKLFAILSILTLITGCDWCGCCKQKQCETAKSQEKVSESTPEKTEMQPVAKMEMNEPKTTTEPVRPVSPAPKAVIPPMPSAPKNA